MRSQRQIAKQLGIDHAQVNRWLMHFRRAPECITDPALPDAATLDAIAAKIREEAKSEVRAEVASEVRAEIEAIRKDFAARLEALNEEIAARGASGGRA